MTYRIRQAVNTHPTLVRWVLAGPGALGAALCTIMAMPLWLPKGDAGLDNIAFPLIFTPLIWAVIFVYACLDERLPRIAAVIFSAILIQGAMIAATLAGLT